jgi:BON domain
MARDHGYPEPYRDASRDDRSRDPRSDDLGQADYSQRYGYDPQSRSGYRRSSDEDDLDPRRYDERPRSWSDARDRAAPQQRGEDAHRRQLRGPSDRVLWAIILEKLERERGLDLRDVDIRVEDGEVTLNGQVRRKADKRRIEDLADIDGVRNVQNNLRQREEGRRWTFL